MGRHVPRIPHRIHEHVVYYGSLGFGLGFRRGVRGEVTDRDRGRVTVVGFTSRIRSSMLTTAPYEIAFSDTGC